MQPDSELQIGYPINSERGQRAQVLPQMILPGHQERICGNGDLAGECNIKLCDGGWHTGTGRFQLD
jgi:hypothetical protein